MRPLVGLTTAVQVGSGRPPRFRVNQAYVRAVEQAGGAPLLIPSLGATEALRATFDALDAILLPGGADLQPGCYGAAPHPAADEGDAVVDATELALARWALAEDKPILGICRGLQCLNVAAGGTLYQDIPDELPGALVHRWEPRSGVAHGVEIEPDSRLADLLGGTVVEVNSQHHQAVRRVAPGFVVVARAPDGVVEGLERPGHRFAVAVQWHPEELVPGHAPSARLFARFLQVVREGRG